MGIRFLLLHFEFSFEYIWHNPAEQCSERHMTACGARSAISSINTRAGPQSKNWSDQQNTLDPTGYIRKPGGKSLTQKKLILMSGIALEKNGPCSWENEVKISKKRKMAKNHFLRSYFGS